MSDNIDYDELDKAVSEAIQSSNQSAKAAPKTSKTTPKAPVVKTTTAKNSVPVNVVKPTTAKAPARSPRFMDIARPANRVARPVQTVTPATRNITATAPQSARIVSNTPSSHTVRPMKSAAANTVSPKMAAELRKQQLLQKRRQELEQQRRAALIRQQQLARQKMQMQKLARERAAEEERAAASAELAKSAAAAKATIEARQAEEREAPNANNYSLGVRSPFLTNAKVEKRPLGNNIPETSLKDLKSTKNVYSKKSPSKKKQIEKHTIVEAPKKTSGWVWTLMVLFVIAAGAGLGYLAYLLVFNSGF